VIEDVGMVAPGQCTRQLVLIAVKSARYHLNLQKVVRFIAVNVSRNIDEIKHITKSFFILSFLLSTPASDNVCKIHLEVKINSLAPLKSCVRVQFLQLVSIMGEEVERYGGLSDDITRLSCVYSVIHIK